MRLGSKPVPPPVRPNPRLDDYPLKGSLNPVPARRYDPAMRQPPEPRIDKWLRRAMVIAGVLCLLVWATVAMLVIWQQTCGMGAPC